jgi:hypothetical protein
MVKHQITPAELRARVSMVLLQKLHKFDATILVKKHEPHVDAPNVDEEMEPDDQDSQFSFGKKSGEE